MTAVVQGGTEAVLSRGRGATVLVVEDGDDVRELVAEVLERDGYRVERARDGAEGLQLIAKAPPSLVVLDINLPNVDGLEVLGRIRRQHETPVILLSGRVEEADRVIGLELGADDYVVKPFSPRELLARVHAVMRRRRLVEQSDRLEHPGLVIDLAAREVWVGDQLIETRQLEFDLLAFLAASPRQVFSREQLLANVWGSSAAWQDPRTVTEHVRRLRLKLDPPSGRTRIRTVRGIGYRFEP